MRNMRTHVRTKIMIDLNIILNVYFYTGIKETSFD